MKKIFVGGATGRQGNAVAQLLLGKKYEVVAYVRNAAEPKAQELAKLGAIVFEGDLRSEKDLDAALRDVDVMYSMTTPFSDGDSAEIAQGKVLADAAKRYNLHFIFSSAVGADANTGVDHFDNKGVIEQYIRDSGIAATILRPTYFMENFFFGAIHSVRKGVYTLPFEPDFVLYQTTVLDMAAMVLYVIEHLAEMEGRIVNVASDGISGRQITAYLSGVLGKDIIYEKNVSARSEDPEGKLMYDWIEYKDGMRIDLQKLHSEYPTVMWHTFASWANESGLADKIRESH